MTYGNDLPNRLDNETALHIDLRARGYQLYLAGDAVSNHINISDPRAYFRQVFVGQRSFAATRMAAGKWSLGKRLMYVLGSPLIPIVRLRRVIQQIYRANRQDQLLPRGLPLLIAAILCGTAGEVIGYLVGDSQANAKSKSEAELNRRRFLSPSDQI